MSPKHQSSTPIQHVVIITKENHTFDNYFGTFPGANGVTLPQAPDPIRDPNHNHQAWLNRNHKGGAVKLQYKQKDIPSYWALAQQYTLCDDYFTDVASQSEPNHLMLIAANSPLIDNIIQVIRENMANPCRPSRCHRFRLRLPRQATIGGTTLTRANRTLTTSPACRVTPRSWVARNSTPT